jgi:acetyltransferase-like isoleucine patch superfamily enzyme
MRTLLWSIYIAYLRLMGHRTAVRALFHCHHKLRLRILRAFNASVGEGSRVNGPLIIIGRFNDFAGLHVGSHTHIGADSLLDLTANITIGSRVTISPRCSIITHLNVGESILKEKYPPVKANVIIEDDVYIGTCVTILHGIRIGEGAIIAAGALVNKDVPDHTMVAGIPAKPVKKLRTQQAGSDT